MRSLSHWRMTEQAITEFHSSFKDASTLSGHSTGGLTPATETPTARGSMGSAAFLRGFL